MATGKQILGDIGENMVIKNCICPKCKRERTFKKLPLNFKCADIVCDFCGFLAQVKTKNVKDIEVLLKSILGAAWDPQKERRDAGMYFSLYIVLKSESLSSIYFLSADLQTPDMFVVRKPLSKTARRAGWQGFYYDLTKVARGSIVRLS